ncbi:hypothetical protein BURK2_04192 [Burkholderiales bacterium]|nr:MAG: sel1 repeat family protein [Burkholderiales bacterium]CAG1011162.1 hypothetical protein BURK2_04192 [Burkholderiales bacterium]
MGCNGWNHPPGCDCGWGGDTGGGGGGRYQIPVSIWTSRYRDLDSYVNPNATCPVCGAAVFFYQSPFGGRVFFDELGPPWPKHPCTDSSPRISIGGQRGSVAHIQHSGNTTTNNTLPRAPRAGWAPLVVQRMLPRGSIDVIVTDKRLNTLGEAVIPVPTMSYRNRPLFWRHSTTDPSLIQIATFSDSAEGIHGIEVSVPCWISSEAEAAQYVDGTPPSGKDWNSIGWAASFAHKLEGGPDWAQSDMVDWEWARLAFEKAEESGFWPASNNLGVMYREGYGVRVDADIAFSKFMKAAQSLDPIPLRHLAKCYRLGFGTAIDDSEADYLEELAELQEAERKGKQ